MKKTRNLATTVFILIVMGILFSGCGEKANSYSTISPEEAKAMMDQDKDLIILDVRTQEEFDTGYIAGAILLPNTDILSTAEEVLTDKDAKILVYCRSGRRSALAATDLASMGYKNVFDFGGIQDWPYDIVVK